MPVDSYMLFKPYNADPLDSESQVVFPEGVTDEVGKPFLDKKSKGKLFEVTTFSFDVEQTINLSSQASGGGAGKVQFNPFKVTRKIDRATSEMFRRACNGTHFETVHLGFRKAGGVAASGLFFLRFDFKLVLLKSISWSHDDESPTEDLEFEYGGLKVTYAMQKPSGEISPAFFSGWNKIQNIEDPTDNPIAAK